MSREFFEDGAVSRYDYILNEFKNLAINRFYWENLPYGLTSEQLELLLISKGELMGFVDNYNGFLILPCMPTTDINVYGIATKYRVEGMNGKYNKTISLDEGVLLKNNPLSKSDIPTLEIFAQRIDNVEMTQDVNLFQQCIPKLILCDENGKLTAKNIVDKIKKFKFVIFGRNSLSSNISTSDVLDTSSPYVLDKLQQQKTDYKNEALAYIAIKNNSNVMKKERMTEDEINLNDEYTETILDMMFDMREKFAKEVNEKFGQNVIVKKREVNNGGNNTNSRRLDRERS